MARGPKNPYQRYKKLERPEIKPARTTLWEYPSANYGKGRQGDTKYRGQTPSFVIWQVLQRWTKKGDVVLDPFCGSGTSLDVCQDLSRKGIGFDLAPTRDDIGAADARALPLDDDAVDHAFFDPPYADNLVYSDDPACIGRTRADDGSWHKAMEDVVTELSRVVRPGGIIAAYVQDVMKPEGFFPLGLELAMLMGGQLVFVDHVCVVRRNKALENERQLQKTADKLARGFNHLLVFANRAA